MTTPATDSTAKDLRGFGIRGSIAVLIIIAANFFAAPVAAVLILVWAKLSATPLSALGFQRSPNWKQLILLGPFVGFTLKLLLKTTIMPLLGAPAINPAYHYLSGNSTDTIWMIPRIIISAGIAEEVVYRGYLFERWQKLFGRTGISQLIIVLLGAALFGAAHYAGQEKFGVEQAFLTGTVFGALFAFTRNIYLVIIVHVFFDLTALAMIYWNLETLFAQLFFS